MAQAFGTAESRLARKDVVQLAPPLLGEAEKRALSAVIDDGWITMGERVARFEQAFAHVHDADEAVAVSSCTTALHLCLAGLGIGRGAEVLVPALTFVATVNAVLYTGAAAVFVDIDSPRRPHISIADAAAKVTPRTRAVIVMHYGGYLCNLPAWRDFADRHGLALIVDAAHAAGMPEAARSSDAAAFSFFGNKNMTTGEGGMIIARRPELRRRLRLMRSHGMTSNTMDRARGHACGYDVVLLGYNYRMDDLRAALGLVQLERLGEWNRARRVLAQDYRRALGERVPGLEVPFDPEWPTSAHIMPVLLPQGADRSAVMDLLSREGIQSSVHYPAAHRFTCHRSLCGDVSLPLSEEFAARELTLPLHPRLSADDVDRVVTTLADAVRSV